MSKRPWYRWFVGDYFTDTAHLTPEEDLLYRRLLDLHWKDRSIPNDPGRLVRLTRLPTPWFESAWPEVSRYFREHEGRLVNPRMVAEIRYVEELSDTRREAANRRWNNDLYANALQVECDPDPDPDPEEEKTGVQGSSVGTDDRDEPAVASQVEKSQTRTKSLADRCPAQAIMALYNELLVPPLPEAQELTSGRRSAMAARWRNGLGDLGVWREYFTSVGDSDFLTGQVPPGPGRSKAFRASLDWLLKEGNHVKVKEGRYHG